GGRLISIHARVARPRAVVGRVVVAHAALRRAHAVRRGRRSDERRAGKRGPRTTLRHVALARRGPARDGGRLVHIDADVARPRAVVGRVVVAHAALRRAHAVRRGRREGVRRTRPRGPRTTLRHVALARRGPARDGGRLVHIDADVARPRAVVGRVVVAHAALRRAHAVRRGRREGVRRTRPRGPRTTLRHVALARRGPARDGGRLVHIDADVARPRAVVGRVVVAHAALRRAHAVRRGRLEGVRRTRPRGPRTTLRHVALARRGPARDSGRLIRIHARVARPRAVVGRVVVAHAAVRRARALRAARGEGVRRTRARGPCA